MIMPSFTTLPESMLGPAAIRSKFDSATLAGLGLGDEPIDLTLDPSTFTYGNSVVSSNAGWDINIPDPLLNFSTDPSTYTYGNSQVTGGGSSTAGGLTPAQEALLGTQILNAGTNLAKIYAVGATGATVLPNGAIIAKGNAVPLAAGSVATSGLAMAAVIGVAVFAFFMSRK